VACRPAASIRGLFGTACSPTMGKAYFVVIKGKMIATQTDTIMKEK